MNEIGKVGEAFSTAKAQFNKKIDQIKKKHDLLNKLKQVQAKKENIKSQLETDPLATISKQEKITQRLKYKDFLTGLKANPSDTTIRKNLTEKIDNFLKRIDDVIIDSNIQDDENVTKKFSSKIRESETQFIEELNRLKTEYSSYLTTIEFTKNEASKLADAICNADKQTLEIKKCEIQIQNFEQQLRELTTSSYPKEFLKALLSSVKTFFSTLLSDMNKTASATQNHIEPTVDSATTEKNRQLNEKFVEGVTWIFNPQFVLDIVLDRYLGYWLNQPMYGEYAAEMHDIKNVYSTMRDLCWQITQNHNTNPQIDDKLAKAREKLIATLIRNPQNQNTETFIKTQLNEIANALHEVSASIQAIAETSPQIKAENIEDLTVQDNTVVEDFDTAEEQLNDEITEEKMAPIISKYDLSGIEEVKDTESV